MNPNTRKRHDAMPKTDQCPDTRGNPEGKPRTRAEKRADKSRLFPKAPKTPKAPKSDKKASGLDKAHAALVRKAKRNLGLSDVLDITDSRNTPVAPVGPVPVTLDADDSLASRLWEQWMNTQQKRTFEQYCEAWVADNTG